MNMPKMSYPRVAVVIGLIWAAGFALALKNTPIRFLENFLLFVAGWYVLDLLEYAIKHRPRKAKPLTLTEVKFSEESKPRPNGEVSGEKAAAPRPQDQ